MPLVRYSEQIIKTRKKKRNPVFMLSSALAASSISVSTSLKQVIEIIIYLFIYLFICLLSIQTIPLISLFIAETMRLTCCFLVQKK